MSTMQTFDPERAKKLLAEADVWAAREKAKAEKAKAADPSFNQVRQQLVDTIAQGPETVEIPYHMTPEGERWQNFKKVCDERFLPKIDYTRVKNRAAFDRVINWDGTVPGPCSVGDTGMGKTFASWWALRRLYVRENRAFAWFPARRLCTELQKYEDRGCADEFFRTYGFFKVLFIDDLEKINWQFQSHSEMLFSFFDWAYRTNKPCLVTTNKNRGWWADKMGDAFVRRLFDEACTEVNFS